HAAIGLWPGPKLHLENEIVAILLRGVKIANAALALGILGVHDDDAVLDLDAAIRRLGLAVHRSTFLAGVDPTGKILAVEKVLEAFFASLDGGCTRDKRHDKQSAQDAFHGNGPF